MTDRQWETRLLAVLAAVLVVFGLVAVYGASSLVATGGGEVGADFALRQLLGAVVGGIVATWLARSDYHVWRRAAWPLLGVTALLLVIPLLPFTHRIAPTINGGRAHRALPARGRRRRAAGVRRGRERAVPARPGAHVPQPGQRALRGDVAGASVARRPRVRPAVRRRAGPGAAKARLPAVRLLRLHLLDDRRGMGLPRRARDRRAVRHVHVGRVPHRPLGARCVRPAARRRADGADRVRGVAPHRREPRAAPRHRHHAPVHFVRP